MTGFVPNWPAPEGVGAYITDRRGGASVGPYTSNNLGLHVGDQPELVESNRSTLLSQLGVKAQWLEQVHGVEVVQALGDGAVREADACCTQARGLACIVMTADCLPVLLCDEAGSQVGAVHCGWRGLADGILERTLSHFAAPRGRMLAYLGPAISQTHYEVGAEVERALALSLVQPADFSKPNPARPGHYFVDLYAVARAQLCTQGLTQIYGGQDCSFSDDKRFYSYRRDGVTGRMASLIWLR